MANLKEILPVVLAGIGGAASPQGADVFNNMAQMMQERQRYKATEERAMRQEARADEGLQLRKDEAKAATSLREIKLREAKAAEEERAKAEERRAAALDWYSQNVDPSLPEEEQVKRRAAFGFASDPDEMGKMAEKFGMMTLQEKMDLLNANPDGGSITEQGLTLRKAGVQPDGTLQQPEDLSIAIMDDKGFQSGIKELMGLREKELNLVVPPSGSRIQGDGPGPAQQMAAIEAQRDVVIHQLVKRAALMSGGDKNVFMDAVNDIYVAAGRPVPTAKKATEIAAEETAEAAPEESVTGITAADELAKARLDASRAAAAAPATAVEPGAVIPPAVSRGIQ